MSIKVEEYEGLCSGRDYMMADNELFLSKIHEMLKKENPSEAMNYLKPIRHMLFEASMFLTELRNKRIEDVADLIRETGIEPGNRLDGFDWDKLRDDLSNEKL